MTEIRLCWDSEIDPEREAECAGPWLPLINKNLETLESLVVAGADGYGDGTHWIEQRELTTIQKQARDRHVA